MYWKIYRNWNVLWPSNSSGNAVINREEKSSRKIPATIKFSLKPKNHYSYHHHHCQCQKDESQIPIESHKTHAIHAGYVVLHHNTCTYALPRLLHFSPCPATSNGLWLMFVWKLRFRDLCQTSEQQWTWESTTSPMPTRIINCSTTLTEGELEERRKFLWNGEGSNIVFIALKVDTHV